MEQKRRTQLKQAWSWNGRLQKRASLLEALGFPEPSAMPRIVSFVGGGGKTTSMYHLAEELCQAGLRVLVTTSTHIQYPQDGTAAVVDHVSELQSDAAAAEHGSELRGRAAGTETERSSASGTGQVLTAGRLEEKTDESGHTIRKLTMPEGLGEPEAMARLLERFDAILIEADGAKCRPVKVPGEQEPVLVPQTGLVIACAGLSAIGRPFGEVCFRFGSKGGWLRRSEENPVEPEDLALILMDERGSRKQLDGRYYRIILNQADGAEALEQAEQVIAALPVTLQSGCVVTAYEEKRELRFHARLRVYYEDRNFGPGVAELMTLVRRYGSLAAACKEMGMAYSKAWKVIKRAEADLGIALMEGSRGGGNGGRTELTPEGEAFLEQYLAFQAEANEVLAGIFQKHFGTQES